MNSKNNGKNEANNNSKGIVSNMTLVYNQVRIEAIKKGVVSANCRDMILEVEKVLRLMGLVRENDIEPDSISEAKIPLV